MAKALVMGASGFLGSHVVRELVAAGQEVRIMVRASSDTRAIDHLPVERVVAELSDREAIGAALRGCDSVFYCIVDTRAWLRDPAPLYATNVDSLRSVLEIALEYPLKRFVFTSSYATIGLNPSGVSSEVDTFNWWDKAPDYVKCRVEAEDMFLQFCRDRGLPGVACCVGNTYGADDVAPTPHGKMVKDVALGYMKFYWDGGGPCVGIRDAARALLLAQSRGAAGERYIVAERWVDYRELFALAAECAGVAAPQKKIPLAMLYAMARVADAVSFVTRRDSRFSVASLRCSTLLPNVDSAKARRDLAWQPEPIEKSIAEAVDYYLSRP